MIAKGVESQEQLLSLNEEGCSLAQRFLLSKPLISYKFETFETLYKCSRCITRGNIKIVRHLFFIVMFSSQLNDSKEGGAFFMSKDSDQVV